MNMKSGYGTAKRILDEVPDASAEMKADLKSIADGVFLELPEDDRVWRSVHRCLCKFIPNEERQLLDWHKKVIQIWKEETR